MTRHRGKARGITVHQLASEITGQPGSQAVERQIRHLVVELRKKGIPICACPSHGYYLAETKEELQETLKHLRDRALTSLQQVRGLRRGAMPDLAGQLGIDVAEDRAQ